MLALPGMRKLTDVITALPGMRRLTDAITRQDNTVLVVKEGQVRKSSVGSKTEVKNVEKTKRVGYQTLKTLTLHGELIQGLEKVWERISESDRECLKSLDQLKRIQTIAILGLVKWRGDNRESAPDGFSNFEKEGFGKKVDLPKFQTFCADIGYQEEVSAYVKLHDKRVTAGIAGTSKEFGVALHVFTAISSAEMKKLRSACDEIDKRHGIDGDNERNEDAQKEQRALIASQNFECCGQLVARLTISNNNDDPEAPKTFKREVDFLKLLNHFPQFPAVFDEAAYVSSVKVDKTLESKEISATVGKEKHVIYMELCQDMETFLKVNGVKNRLPFLPKLFYDFLQGLVKLQELQIIYGDIKIDNMLVKWEKQKDGENRIQGKYVDFGSLRYENEPPTSIVGTFQNFSPERRTKDGLLSSHLDDVFALGYAFRSLLSTSDYIVQRMLDWFFACNDILPSGDCIPPADESVSEGQAQDLLEDLTQKIRQIRQEKPENLGDLKPDHLDLVIQIHPLVAVDLLKQMKGLTNYPKTVAAIRAYTTELLRLISDIEMARCDRFKEHFPNADAKGEELLWNLVTMMLCPDMNARKDAATLFAEYGTKLLELDKEWNPAVKVSPDKG